MHSLPRLPPTRPPPRRRPFPHNPLPPLHRLPNRARRRQKGLSTRSLDKSPPRLPVRDRYCSTFPRGDQEVQHNMETRRLAAHSQRIILLGFHVVYCVLSYPSSITGYNGRSPRHNRLAQSRLLRFHKPRPPTRIPAPFFQDRRPRSGDLCFLSVS